MSRRWLGIALLLSLGVNLGIVAVLLGERLWPDGRGGELDQPERPRLAGPADPIDGPHPRGGVAGLPEPPADGLPPVIARRLHLLADRLGLHGERRERFLEIQREFFLRTHERRTQIVTLQERFRRELAAPEPAPDEVQRLIRELGKERTALEEAFARAVLDSRELLEPPQERVYLQFLARLRAGGPGGPPGPGGPGGPARGGRPDLPRRPR